MTIEYILVLTLFVLFMFGTLMKGPRSAYENAGPLLGARIEQHLTTGNGFNYKGGPVQWEKAQ